VCIHYPAFFPVFESDWSPFGNESGLCVGAFSPVFNGENVTLQNCGSSTSTLWVGDLRNGTTHRGRIYTPWVNGAGQNFSHLLTLQVDPGTKKPNPPASGRGQVSCWPDAGPGWRGEGWRGLADAKRDVRGSPHGLCLL
jgi:hypothetical protein